MDYIVMSKYNIDDVVIYTITGEQVSIRDVKLIYELKRYCSQYLIECKSEVRIWVHEFYLLY